MDFAEIDIEYPSYRTEGHDRSRPRAQRRVRADRKETVRLPTLSRADAVHFANVHSWAGHAGHPVWWRDGAFYSKVLHPAAGAAAQLNALLAPPRYGGAERGALSEADVPELVDRFAVMDGELVERIHEPVWLVDTSDTGGRMNTRDNAKQGVALRLSLKPTAGPQDFRGPQPIPPSGAPCTMLAPGRLDDAVRLLPGVAADTAWGQVTYHDRGERIDVLRPELSAVDDRAGSFAMVGPMLSDLCHGICARLSRGGIENWIALRRATAASGSRSEREWNEVQTAAAALLRELRVLKTGDMETDVRIKRARNCAAMTVHRLELDNAYEREPEIDIDAGAGLSP